MNFFSCSRLAFLGFLLGTSSCAAASVAAFRESLVVTTGLEPESRGLPDFPGLPRRVSAGFGVVPTRVVTATPSLRNTGRKSVPVCGPSMSIHTLVCRSLLNGQFLEEIPIPGNVSSTPVFHEGSWLVGTSEGFFLRFARASAGSEAPSFRNPASLSFWSGEARRAMASARRANSDASPQVMFSPDWRWSYAIGAEFTGTPVVGDGAVFVTAANQYLYALNWESGKALWTLRLAPDASLRLASTALELSTNRKEVLVGTSEGVLLALAPANGQVLWRHRFGTNIGERFSGIVAKPMALERSVIVSTAEGTTQRLSLDRCAGAAGSRCGSEERAVEWTYATGSVAAPVSFGGVSVAVGGSDGSLALLEAKSGALVWKLSLFRNQPVVAVGKLHTAEGESLVAASADGQVALVSGAGALRGTLPGAGEPVGEFFAGQEASEACLSYAHAGFRCFTAGLP